MTAALLHRIAATVLETAKPDHEIVDVGPFRAFLYGDSKDRAFNFAIPVKLPARISSGVF